MEDHEIEELQAQEPLNGITSLPAEEQQQPDPNQTILNLL